MKPQTKHILWVIGAAFAAYFVWKAYKLLSDGLSDLANLPGNLFHGFFSDVKAAWKAVTGLFGSNSNSKLSPAALATATKYGVLNTSGSLSTLPAGANTPVVITTTGTVAPPASLFSQLPTLQP